MTVIWVPTAKIFIQMVLFIKEIYLSGAKSLKFLKWGLELDTSEYIVAKRRDF